MLRWIAIALLFVAGFWGALVFLAARLPPGLLKDLVLFLPSCVTMLRRLRRDPRVPARAKIALLLAAIWVVSPIDLIPEFLPVIGPLDDLLVLVLALRYAGRSVPHSVLREAWPGDPKLLDRLLSSEPGSAPPALPAN